MGCARPGPRGRELGGDSEDAEAAPLGRGSPRLFGPLRRLLLAPWANGSQDGAAPSRAASQTETYRESEVSVKASEVPRPDILNIFFTVKTF